MGPGAVSGKRDRQPETEPHSLRKLDRRLDAQLHAGALPTKSRRRRSIAERGARLLHVKQRLKAKAARVAASCREMQKASTDAA